MFITRINHLILFLFLFLLLSAKSELFGQRANSKTGRQLNKTTRLFNGKNLDGWYTFLQNRGRDNDPKQVFTVKNKMLYISGEEWGCITTNEEYENYRLVAKYKWTGKTHAPRENKAMDGGILLHSQGKDGGYRGIWMHSVECQIIEGGTGDFIVVNDSTQKYAITVTAAPQKQDNCYVFDPGGQPAVVRSGRANWYGRDEQWKDVKGFRGRNDVEKPIGEWNTLECHVKADTIAIYLNGTLVNLAYNVRPARGRIQIQSEGAGMVFKKVEITPLNGAISGSDHTLTGLPAARKSSAAPSP